MTKTPKLLAVLALVCFTSLIIAFHEVTVTNATSSNGGNCEEQIFLEIEPYNGQVLFGFTFTNVSFPT